MFSCSIAAAARTYEHRRQYIKDATGSKRIKPLFTKVEHSCLLSLFRHLPQYDMSSLKSKIFSIKQALKAHFWSFTRLSGLFAKSHKIKREFIHRHLSSITAKTSSISYDGLIFFIGCTNLRPSNVYKQTADLVTERLQYTNIDTQQVVENEQQ